MQSVTTTRFREAFDQLPEKIKDKARRVYRKWKEDPQNPIINSKLIHSKKLIYSIRIGLAYRALGVKEGNTVICFGLGLMRGMIS